MAATLTVWKFDGPSGAWEALSTLEGLADRGLLFVNDAATVSWEEGGRKPKVHQRGSMAGAGAAFGSFWGLLFGLIFFVPLLGAAVGAGLGAAAGSLTDLGIDDEFIERMRAEVTPGTSALFVLSQDVVVDKVHDAFAAHRPTELLYTSLSGDQERTLREAFLEE